MVKNLTLLFPGLQVSTFQVTSPPTRDYNCIAWAAGDAMRLLQTSVAVGTFVFALAVSAGASATLALLLDTQNPAKIVGGGDVQKPLA